MRVVRRRASEQSTKAQLTTAPTPIFRVTGFAYQPMQLHSARVRLAEVRDTAALLALQTASHAVELHECSDVFSAILEQRASYVAVADSGERAVGYALLHSGDSAALGAVVNSCPCCTASCFLHDVVVAPEWRGGGTGARLVAAALQSAAERGHSDVHLVALPGTEAYWRRQLFTEEACGHYTDAASYGHGALHLRRLL